MKHFFTVALVLAALTAQAQQGSIYLGGQVGFNTSTTEVDNNGTKISTGKVDNYSFSPEIGTFLTNQVQLGVGFTFSGSYRETPFSVGSAAVSKTTRYGGTVYSRYFFGEGNFRPFLGLNTSVLPGNSTTGSGGPVNSTIKYNTLDLGANLNAGFAYGLNTRFTVVGSFGTLGF
ncbi:MAG: outer membrane beta-barrel protein [Bacteroidota bacterium]|nr:outer membrane beta-barrel protein [Bacteroidota bacterium]